MGDPPDEMFGKVMSISDDLMWRWFNLLSFRPVSEIEGFRREIDEGRNPRDVKFLLGKEIVARFYGEALALRAYETFVARFQKGAVPDEMPEITLVAEAGTSGLPIGQALCAAGLVSSTSEAFRMIKQGAVKVDGEKVVDRALDLVSGDSCVCQVGKRRFARVTVVRS